MKRGFLNSSKAQKNALYPEKKAETSNPYTPIKPPHGKVENRELPQGYKTAFPQQKIAEMNANTTDYAENVMVYTTVPPNNNSPDGNTEWIVEGPTKQKFVGTPGFPKPLPKVSGPPSYEVRPTPDMGLGCFATRDIQVGDLVFAERPLLVSPRGMKIPDMNSASLIQQYGMHKYQMILLAEYEKVLEVAVGRMSDENRKAFMELANNHKEDGSGPILGIIRTNGYGTSSLFDGPEVLEDQSNLYSSVLKIGSRINHSCRPNVGHEFDVASFSYQFRAQRDIKAGEQLFYSYCGLDQSAAARKAELAPYGVVCNCLSCVNATPESDKFRAEFQSRVIEIAMQFPQWMSNPSLYLKRSQVIQQGLIDEGLEATKAFVNNLQTMSVMHKFMGQSRKQKELADQFVRYNRVAKLPVML